VRVAGETMFATTGYDIYADDYVQLHDPAG
jgi:hypothetical protein